MITLQEAASIALRSDIKDWDSLIVNLRKPHTYRAFMYVGDDRICLHKFTACSDEDAFMHPHPWPCRIHIFEGVYRMWVGHSASLDSQPENVMTMKLGLNSSYEILENTTWHKVHPVTDCYSLMVNSKPWDVQHEKAPTTAGKDLDKFTNDELDVHIKMFTKGLIRLSEGY